MESDRAIPAPAKSLGNLIKGGTQAVRFEVMKASASHSHFLPSVQQDEAVTRSAELESQITGKPVVRKTVEVQGLGRGDEVVDIERKRKGTVIRVLKAEGKVRYEVVDREGNAWEQRLEKLRKRS